MTRSCGTCGSTLGKRAKSDLCRPCRARLYLGNPEARAKAKAGLRRHFSDPQVKAARARQSQANLAAWRASPEGAAALTAMAKKNLALASAPEHREKRVRGIRAAAYPGIPEDRWDEVKKLASHMPAAEAKRIVL